MLEITGKYFAIWLVNVSQHLSNQHTGGIIDRSTAFAKIARNVSMRRRTAAQQDRLSIKRMFYQ